MSGILKKKKQPVQETQEVPEPQEVPQPSQSEYQGLETQSQEPSLEEEQPSTEDSIDKFHDDAFYRSNLISVLVQGFNQIILEMRESNDLLKQQNELLSKEE